MKLRNLLFAALACVLLAACAPTAEPSETTAATVPESRETTTATTAPEETEATLPPIVLELTEDEKIDVVARRIMKRFKPAFMELAK